MKKYYIGICCFLSLFLLHSCAQIGTITGGEKDTQPPKILKQNPENNTTNFKDNIISITFDEYVELVNPTETFRLSPTTDNSPNISIKGKTVGKKKRDKRFYGRQYATLFQICFFHRRFY